MNLHKFCPIPDIIDDFNLTNLDKYLHLRDDYLDQYKFSESEIQMLNDEQYSDIIFNIDNFLKKFDCNEYFFRLNELSPKDGDLDWPTTNGYEINRRARGYRGVPPGKRD